MAGEGERGRTLRLGVQGSQDGEEETHQDQGAEGLDIRAAGKQATSHVRI